MNVWQWTDLNETETWPLENDDVRLDVEKHSGLIRSLVFKQAENRLHFHRALLEVLLAR